VIAYIEAQGSLLRLRVLGQTTRKANPNVVRGRIRGFSAKARSRLLRLFARMMMKGVRATFITLTFRRFPTNAEAKRSLKAFMQYIRDNYPEASAVWRMEHQKRGAIHFHLLCFNLPYWHWQDILSVWKSCSNQDKTRIDVRLVRSGRGVMSYVSKYIAKCEKRIGITFFIHPPYQQKGRKWRKGRYWGYLNKKALPLAEKVEGLITDMKTIKRLSNAAWEIIGTDNRYGSLSFHLFYDNAKALAIRNIERWGRYLDEWEYTIKDHTRPKRQYSPYTEHFSEAELSLIRVQEPFGRARASVASSSHPCAAGWVAQSSKAVTASRVSPYFDEHGKVVSV